MEFGRFPPAPPNPLSAAPHPMTTDLLRRASALALLLLAARLPAEGLRTVQAATKDGLIEGVVSADGLVRTFKGIPFAAPPVGPLRWKAPQPVAPWSGVRRTVDYGPRPMQARVFDDMVFHDGGPSEDCLYLNLWIPETAPKAAKLPVMVWIYGGGFVAGSSSEPRQDGGNLCKKGVIVVSMNYRLGVFGLLAHPDLARESGHDASGNYGLTDQLAALRWVQDNIAAFGGDPGNVTIFGESAGSHSVCALIASPLSKGLFGRAIGESGAMFSPKSARHRTRADAEASGIRFAAALGKSSVEELRTVPAQVLLDTAQKDFRHDFGIYADGYVLPDECRAIYAAGRQQHVALLAGWNRDEGGIGNFFGGAAPSIAHYAEAARARFGVHAEEFLKLYPASTDAEADRAARDFGRDASMGYAGWTWLELQRKTAGVPVYRFEFDQTLPLEPGAKPGAVPLAPHAGEIEFVFRVLSSRNLPWRPEDHAVSELMASYWTNFARNGDPNGPGLPAWPQYRQEDGNPVMHLATPAVAAPDTQQARYTFPDAL